MMRPDRYTAARVEHLILAQRAHRHDGPEGTQAILRELLDTDNDAYLLALLLARAAARRAHLLHHLMDSAVRPTFNDEDSPADQAAIQLVAALANDDTGSARDLAAIVVSGDHGHAQRTILSLLHLAARQPQVRTEFTDRASGHVIDPAMN